MKKVWINSSFILNKKTGVGAYLLTFLKALDKLHIDYELQSLNLPSNIKYKYFWEKLWFNSVFFVKTLLLKPDIIIFPSFSMPVLKRKKTKYITVIHDLCSYRLGEMTKLSQWAMHDAIKNTLKKADKIVTVSETVKNELIAKFNVNPDRINVVHNAIADYFIDFQNKPEVLEKYGLEDRKYILSVATMNKRKNIPELIKAFENISDKYPDAKLVLVGGMGNENQAKLTKHPNIIFTGYIKDEEIPVLYKHALMYIFPSVYEGFGTPIMEAQYSGTPLLCSDIPVFREVAGDGAEFCQSNASSIAEKIEYLINHSEHREELIKLGYENVKRFDIKHISEQLIDVKNNKELVNERCENSRNSLGCRGGRKVLLINNCFCSLGGAEVIAYHTYKILRQHGYDAYFWATDKQPYFENDYPYTNYFTKYNGGFLNYIKNPIKYYYNIQAKNDLKKFLKEVKPDIIHLHNIFGMSYSILECCKDIPTVMTIHDAGFVCPGLKLLKNNKTLCNEMLCKKFKYFNCVKNKCFNNSLEASIRHSVLLSVNHKKTKYIDKYITPSNSLKELILKAEVGLTKENIHVIPNCLTDKEISVTPNYKNKGYFLYVGRLTEEKGVQYILDALKQLPKDINLHIAGSGEFETFLKQQAKNNNLTNVSFLGYMNKEQLSEEYSHCIATIVPSKWFEIFGLTNIESFIYGKPVIASNIGGIPEIVENNKTGLLFEPQNIQQLKECILKYKNNPDLVIEHGENAYNKALNDYNQDKYYEKLIKVYEETINSV